MTMTFVDATELSGARVTRDGYLTAKARVARTGVQIYAGKEVDRPEMSTVAVYRGEGAVFARDSLSSFIGKPVTMGHPNAVVTAENWKDHAVGQIGEEIVRDGEAVRVSLALMDAKAIKTVQDGTRQLSVGYRADLEWGDGVAPDGTRYQARQTNIIVDHLAVVDAARAGPEFRIGDGAVHWGASPVTTQTADERTSHMADLRKVLVDGLSVETTDAGAQAITKLQTDVTDARTKLTDAETAHKKVIADKDSEIAKKDAEIEDLKKKVLDDKALDAKVQARADLVGKAKTVVGDVKTEGLSDHDIRKAVVASKLGDEGIKDRSEAYIDARFDVLVEDSGKGDKTDPLRTALGDGIRSTDGANAWGDSVFASAGVAARKGA